jgi:hypothetical protein
MRILLLLALACLTGACTVIPTGQPASTVWPGPDVAGRLQAAGLAESSGLSASRRQPNLLWSHNDSGGQPVLFALDATGAHLGSVRLIGVTNVDWEDVAAFEWNGRSWLLIADVGDNNGRRTDCVLHIIAEPDLAELDPTRELSVPVAWSLPVRYADGGAYDCEAVAVDANEGMVYLLTKRTQPARLYRLPLHPDQDQPTPAAQPAGEVPHIPQPDALRASLMLPTGRWSGQPVALDFAPDGSAAAVLTYVSVLIFLRQPDEDWTTALGRAPAQILPFLLPQAEAMGFSADSQHVFVTTEGAHSPLLRYTRAGAP